jgi:mRNA interferase MazF
MKKYQIVLVKFPFDDLSQSKVRPALCLTQPVGKRRYIIVAFISSRVPSVLESYDVLIDDQHQNFSETELHSSSVIQLQRVISVPEDLILRDLGVLPESLHELVAAKWLAMFNSSTT